MTERRVAITGIGVVTAAGIGMESLWQALLEGRQCIKPIDVFDPSGFPCRVAGSLGVDFSARKFVPKSYRKAVKVMARDIEIAVACADLAVKDAGLVTRAEGGDTMTVPSRKLGCNIGAGLISADLNELGEAVTTAVTDGKFDQKTWGRSGINNLTPLWLLKYLPNMLACHVTIIHGCEGPSNAITCEDASGQLSVGEAARWIQRGEADAVIAGAAECKLTPMGLLRQCLVNRVCTSRNDDPGGSCRPFDVEHDGTVVGEGGGLMVLEEMDHAQKRGAKIHAELVGFGAACDPAGVDLDTPTAGGMDRAVAAAAADAGIGTEEIDVVVAHGTGVKGEDDLEAQAWASALGDGKTRAAVTAVTGTIGSLYAGDGGASLGVAAACLRDQVVPGTLNFTGPSNDCGLGLSAETREGAFEYAVCGAFSLGGQSAACILKKYQA